MLCTKAISAFLVVLLVLVASVCNAQENHQHDHNEKLGQVHFPVSCSSAAQTEFNQAVAMLHSFWYEKAQDSFAGIASREPSCAMAYWGLAMTFYHPLWEKPNAEALLNGWRAVEKARSAAAKTDREKNYIAAIKVFYEDYGNTGHLPRVIAYEEEMEQLHNNYPDDKEAGVFYALALLASAQASPTDKTYQREKKAADILNKVISTEPQHPGAIHYLIHSYDSPALANLALNAARSYAKVAPSVPHALHMPSHIFTRLGLWQDSIESNIASEAAAKDFARQTHMDGTWDEQLHAMDYLMYAYLQSAQDKEAKSVLDELYQIRKTTPENFKVAYAFAAIPARYALERKQWSEAAALKVYPADFPWNRVPWAEAVTHFARAVGAARTGDITAAKGSISRLATLENMLTDPKERAQVDIQRLAALAWLAYAQKKKAEALGLMRSAADLEDSTEKHPVTPGPVVPAREMLGEMLLEVGEPGQALSEFEKSLQVSPNRFGSLLGAARAAKLMKDANKARSYYSKLAAICERADSDRVELQEARTFLGAK